MYTLFLYLVRLKNEIFCLSTRKVYINKGHTKYIKQKIIYVEQVIWKYVKFVDTPM